jgi:alpha-L-rhamnosidase
MKNIFFRYSLFIFPFLILEACSQRQSFSATRLRTEYLKNPWGVDVKHPRFTWNLKSNNRGVQQKAYQILVASSRKFLTNKKANMWNSQEKNSSKTINVAYEGKPLKSNRTYYWKVHARNQKNEDAWSRTGRFHTGLFKQSDWQGSWISARDTSISAPLLRKKFTLKKPIKQATAFVTGVGYYEFYLNGKKVGNHVLDPPMTNYRKRVLYASYDVTNQLKKGANAVGIILGNGAWRMKKLKNRYTRQNRNWGPPRALLQLDIKFKDGTSIQVVTDTTWKSSPSALTYNNFYGGEDYDARREQPGWSTSGFDDSAWKEVRKVAPPGGVLKSEMMQPIEGIKTIKPIKRTHPSKGVYLFGLRQNIAGWWRIHVKGKRGVKLRIYGAETLNDSLFPAPLEPDDKLSTKFKYHSEVYSDYTLKGGGTEIYEPRFFFTGFRYIGVKADHPNELKSLNVEGRVVQSALPIVGRFSSSDSLLNKIHHAAFWSIRGNTLGYPSDSPQREKGAYTGDGEVIAEAAMHDFNMAAFYTNWMADMHDAQQDNGRIPNTAPTLVGGYGGGIPWGSAYILIPWWVHEYYGDARLMKLYYDSMKKYMYYLHYLACHDSEPKEKYIINDFGGYWYSLGEWMAPEQTDGPNHPVVSTAYWYNDAVKFAQMAQILGKKKDFSHFTALADTIKHAFNRKFLNPKTNLYGTKTPYQTYQILALAFGLTPKSYRSGVMHELIYDIKQNHNDHLNTGILGTKYLFPVLMNSGHGDLLYKVVTQKTYPGWGYWMEHGATTLWETWSGKDSHNHQMFGSVDEYFYEYLAGIRPPTGKGSTTAYGKILIKPYIPDSLKHVEASLETIQGKIKSSWTHKGNHLKLEVTLPANSTGKVSIPELGLNDIIITESGKSLWKNGQYVGGDKGISGGARQGKYITFDVTSGDYSFKLAGKK